MSRVDYHRARPTSAKRRRERRWSCLVANSLNTRTNTLASSRWLAMSRRTVSIAYFASIWVALFLGRVHPKKNVAFLVEAWNRARIAPDYHLVGGGLGHHAYLADVRPECKALSPTNPHKTDMIGSK